MGLDLPAKVLLLPSLQFPIVLLEYGLQSRRIQPCRLPQLRARWLDKRMRVERVALHVLRRLNVQTESRAYQRPAGLGIGIRRQHPAFMPAVAQHTHQALESELDIGIRDVKQRLQRAWNLRRRSKWWTRIFQRETCRSNRTPTSRLHCGPFHLGRWPLTHAGRGLPAGFSSPASYGADQHPGQNVVFG